MELLRLFIRTHVCVCVLIILIKRLIGHIVATESVNGIVMDCFNV